MVEKRQIFVVVFRLSIQYILRFYKAILECQLLRDYLQREKTATPSPPPKKKTHTKQRKTNTNSKTETKQTKTTKSTSIIELKRHCANKERKSSKNSQIVHHHLSSQPTIFNHWQLTFHCQFIERHCLKRSSEYDYA